MTTAQGYLFSQSVSVNLEHSPNAAPGHWLGRAPLPGGELTVTLDEAPDLWTLDFVLDVDGLESDESVFVWGEGPTFQAALDALASKLRKVREWAEGFQMHAGVKSTREALTALVAKNRELMTAAIERGAPFPCLAGLLDRNKFAYAPDPVNEQLRDVAQILAASRGPLDIEELTAWRVAELQVRGEASRFEIIGFFREDGPLHPQSLLIVRDDGRFENPEHPGTE